MNTRQRTALVAVVLNAAFTVLKFAIYRFSGSLAVLAEAWHSLADILTSLLVFFALRDAVTAAARARAPGEETVRTEIPVLRLWRRTPAEQRVSFLIGLFIAVAALGVIHKAVFSPPAVVSSPALTGFFFLLFALGSFVVSRFEARMGKEHNSPGLIADSLHSRADMVGALITGFSMLIIQLGLNVDRPAALLISLLMIRCAWEILSNLLRARRGKEGWREGAAAPAWAACRESEIGRRIRESFRMRWKASPLPGRRKTITRISALALAAGALFILLRLCFYTVGPAQEAVRERWGRPVNWGRPIGPGLHLKWPWEKAIRVDSRRLRSLAVGNAVSSASAAYLWTVDHGTEEPFLSGDNNFFYPYVVVHYRIKDIFPYLYRHRQPEAQLDDIATMMLTRIFSQREFYDIAIVFRRAIEDELRQEAQRSLDALNTGLEIVEVAIRDIHPPISIATSYEMVIAAWQAKEQVINAARGYRNRSLPEARAREAKDLAEAVSYSTRKREASEGETGGFLKRSAAFRTNPPVLARRLFLQAAGEMLADRRIILIDPAAGVPELWSRIIPFAQPAPRGTPDSPSDSYRPPAYRLPARAPDGQGEIPEEEYLRGLRDKL